METPLLVLRPSIVHALLPATIVRLVGAVIVLLPLAGLAWIVSFLGLNLAFSQWLELVIFAAALMVFVPLIKRLVILVRTKYLFFNDRVVQERSIISVERHSVPYSQITNVKTRVNLWSRLCGAGELTLVTGQDQIPNLVLEYISNPHAVEHRIYELVHSSESQTKQEVVTSPSDSSETFKSKVRGGVQS